MNKRNSIIGTLVVILATGVAWAFGLFGGADPAVAELQQMREQMFAQDVPDAQRQQLRDDFRQRMEGLSEDQRRALFDSGRQQWEQFAQQRMDEFFSLPPVDQKKRLDDMINRMVERQKERAKNPNSGTQANNGGGRGNRPPSTEAQRDQRAKQRLDRSTPQMRAQRDEFRKMLNARMKERGLDPSKMQGRPPGGGWGGGRT
jgi:hypothetical protein